MPSADTSAKTGVRQTVIRHNNKTCNDYAARQNNRTRLLYTTSRMITRAPFLSVLYLP